MHQNYLSFMCDESPVEDFENLRSTGAAALKKIGDIYKDVMGCSQENENNVKVDEYDEYSLFDDDITDTQKVKIFRDDQMYPKMSGSPGSCLNQPYEKDNYKVSQINSFHHPKYVSRRVRSHNYFQSSEHVNGFQSNLTDGKNLNNKFQHSAFLSKRVKNKKDVKCEKYETNVLCTVKVTTPEPFKMTIRESNTRVAKELKKHQLKEKWNMTLKREMNKKIHAKPVPGHVHLPLYKKIVEMYEKKKVQRKEQKAERLEAIVKPFNLTWQQEKTVNRSASMPNLNADENAKMKMFKAKPAPKNILSNHISEKLKANEEIRKLRIAQRAKEMLQRSSVPFTEIRPIRKCQSTGNIIKENHEEKKAFYTKPHLKGTKCPFSKEQCKQTIEEWNAKVSSVNEAENLQTLYIERTLAKVTDHLASQFLPVYDLPVKMTMGAMLREKQIKAQLEGRKLLNEKMDEEEYERRQREKEMQKIFGPKLKNMSPVLDMKKEIEEKLKSYRESRLLRQQEYEQELEEMMARIEKRPLLMERQVQCNGKAQQFKEFSSDDQVPVSASSNENTENNSDLDSISKSQSSY